MNAGRGGEEILLAQQALYTLQRIPNQPVHVLHEHPPPIRKRPHLPIAVTNLTQQTRPPPGQPSDHLEVAFHRPIDCSLIFSRRAASAIVISPSEHAHHDPGLTTTLELWSVSTAEK
ncbi:hypothetical protein [Aestuariimicrobium ganziense]|uniref:hypothetical protein n=1 Tax=Aestuariimicrobium ganziense TaxID=2773677 RepID=UPI001944A641|nr:hypothetical protein [Aestuariimicrobium ganziense]